MIDEQNNDAQDAQETSSEQKNTLFFQFKSLKAFLSKRRLLLERWVLDRWVLGRKVLGRCDLGRRAISRWILDKWDLGRRAISRWILDKWGVIKAVIIGLILTLACFVGWLLVEGFMAKKISEVRSGFEKRVEAIYRDSVAILRQQTVEERVAFETSARESSRAFERQTTEAKAAFGRDAQRASQAVAEQVTNARATLEGNVRAVSETLEGDVRAVSEAFEGDVRAVSEAFEGDVRAVSETLAQDITESVTGNIFREIVGDVAREVSLNLSTEAMVKKLANDENFAKQVEASFALIFANAVILYAHECPSGWQKVGTATGIFNENAREDIKFSAKRSEKSFRELEKSLGAFFKEQKAEEARKSVPLPYFVVCKFLAPQESPALTGASNSPAQE